jgi:hypothetical protein
MPLLDGFGKMYDRYRVNSVQLCWRTSVGTTKSGAVILGIDGAADTVGTTIAYAQSLYPKWRGAVWAEGTVTPNVAELMPQRWLNTASTQAAAIKADHGAFAGVIAVIGGDLNDKPGEVWCRYDVDFRYPVGVQPEN